MLKIPVTFESFTLYFGKLCFPSVLYRATANGSDTVLGAHLFLPPALVALCLFPLPIIATTIAGIHHMFVWVLLFDWSVPLVPVFEIHPN